MGKQSYSVSSFRRQLTSLTYGDNWEQTHYSPSSPTDFWRILKQGPSYSLVFSCLEKWHSAANATVIQLCVMVPALETQVAFSPQDLCLIDSLTITGIAHIFSSFLSQHGHTVIQHWLSRPHLQLGLDVGSLALSAPSALPWYGDFGNEHICGAPATIPSTSSCSFIPDPSTVSTQPSVDYSGNHSTEINPSKNRTLTREDLHLFATHLHPVV